MTKVQNKKVVKKTINKADLAAFSKPKNTKENTLSMMLKSTAENNETDKKVLSDLREGKKAAKQELFGEIKEKGQEQTDLKTPFILIFATTLNGEKELIPREELFGLLKGCLAVKAKVMVIDSQQPSDINNLGELGEKHEGHVIWYNPDTDNSGKGREEKEIDRLLLAADMAIVFSEQMDLIKLLLSYGVILIAGEKSPFLENYKPNEETGNAFLFKKLNSWSVYASLVRALETFKFPYDWGNIVRKVYK